MFGASETPYDLRFRLLGIPVRIHPLFWVISAMLGWRSENIPVVTIWVGCVFVSILVHEFGHALVARSHGASPSVLLHAFGGLCIYPPERESPRQRLAVLLWGPGAGFVLGLVVMLGYSALYGLTFGEHLAFIKSVFRAYLPFLDRLDWIQPLDHLNVGSGLSKLGYGRDLPGQDAMHAIDAPFEIYWALISINLMWGLINLLPIWPLDGGQVTQTVLSQANPYHGRRWTHVVSLIVAALCAVVIYSQSQSLFNTLFFAYFAVINYQMLDMIHRAHHMGMSEDDLWRR